MEQRSQSRQYLEAIGVIVGLTYLASIAPVSYRAFSLVDLLGLLALSLRVSRGPLLAASLLSAAGWDFFVIPPRYSFRILDIDDTAMFGTYVMVALLTSELTSRIRSQGVHLGAAQERAHMLAESDRLHRALFDSVSHELKTPVTVLRSAAPALLRGANEEQALLVDEICQATERLERVVGNLLDQARLESGMLEPLLDWCDPRDLIQGACAAVQRVLAGRDIHVEVAPDTVLLWVDTPLMEQAIENLLLNAALYSPAGTTITVRSGVDHRLGRAFIAVEDEGPGISEELRPKLFKKFHRGGAANPGGLGLGLSIVQGFVAAQGGAVEAERHDRGGARFTIYLPIVRADSVPEQ